MQELLDNPLWILIAVAAAAYVLKLYGEDLADARRGQPNPRAFPGAVAAPLAAHAWAAVLGLGLVGVATGVEAAVGTAGEQSTITVVFLAGMLSAAVLEELLFRGFLFFDRRGPLVLVGTAVAFSALFAALHFHYYLDTEGGTWALRLNAHALTTVALLFLNSLAFYFVRLASFNPGRSIFPCMTAHAAYNLGVFGVKAATGFVAGWW